MAEKFGKYKLIRRLGSGGMAEVFLARTAVAHGLAKELVIKKIHPAYARSKLFVSMFVAEAKIALGLNHPNVVQVFDFGAVENTFFLAMEYVDGLDLLRLMRQSLDRERPVPVGLCGYIVREVAKALDYAHRKTDEFGEPLGIVHRDVSLQNVLVSWDGAVKLVDFGIARARGMHEDAGVVKGKYAYMSPEQARGDPVDIRSDIYSAGILLFELCCGKPLFPGQGKEALAQVKSGAIPRPRDIRPEIPQRLEQIMLKTLSFHPHDRYATARDLQVALGQFQLEEEKSGSDIIDSEALARFLSEVGGAVRRRGDSSPGATGQLGRRDSTGDVLAGPGRDVSTAVLLSTRFDTSPSQYPPPRRVREIRQRKHVMVLEGRIADLGALKGAVSAERASAITAEFFKIARDIAFKHHAHVHAIGDESLTFLCGVPVAEEDDASRIIRLGLDLIDALDGIGQDVEPELRLAVGIGRGVSMISRSGKNKVDIELPAQEASRARRLAKQGHGAEILVDSQVYGLARPRWYFEELRSADPSADSSGQYDDEDALARRVYRLRGPKERAARLRERQVKAGDIVDRDLELKALRDAYRDVLTRRDKRVILVAGEAGIGKRTLVNALLANIPEDEAVIRRATGQVANTYTAFAIIGDFLRDLLGLAEGAEPREILRRLDRTAAILYPNERNSREARGALAGISMLLGAESRDDGERFDADELRQRVLDAMLRVEKTTAPGRPLILVGEDVHWADDDSIELCRQFFRAATDRPILSLFTSRPDTRIARIASELGADIIRLDELDPDSSIKLITRRFAPAESPHEADDATELARQIVARTGGNPLFIREVLDSLIERGIVADSNRAQPPESGDTGPPGDAIDSRSAAQVGLLRWIGRDVPIQVPASVEALLATRIDHLPEGEKETLMHTAVLGRRSRAEAVSALLGRPAEVDLASLDRRGLLSLADGQYRFCNDMTMSVAYGLLPAAERTRLHQLAAAAIAGQAHYHKGQDDAVIARHLELAGDTGAAVDRYRAAAAHAIDVGGNSDALRQLDRALRLLPAGDHARRFAVHRQREQILHRQARRSEQLREIRQMHEAAEALGESDKLALAHVRLAQYYIDSGKLEAAVRAVTPALDYARTVGDRLIEAEALRQQATIARLVGEGDEALKLCEQAMALCDESRDGMAQRALILGNRGGVLWNMGQLEAAIEAFAESLVIYRMLEMPREEARALNNMGIIFASMGEFEQALAHYKSGLKLDQQLGDRAGIAGKLSNIGQTYADLGDADRAERYLGKAFNLADQMDDRSTAADAMVSLGQVYIERAEYSRATRALERGLSMARESRSRYEEIRALVYLAISRLEAGDRPDGALELARSATQLAEAVPMPVGQIFGMSVQGMALAELGQTAQAADISARAVALQSELEWPEAAEQILYIHATLCEAAGRSEDAARAISAAQREVEVKSDRLDDEVLRAIYLDSRTSRAIQRTYKRLLAT